ncbi:Cof-type HAD-IIB family hydrolase [Furfurilactobacillus entadae]|uniref:Cof-type HAD-IIB family hydrolase n=1 Tax=Furfurilactobacillus entadae TaxID=2922307 RepID=UPI0035E62DB1
MIKMVALDLDGTLLTSDKRISPRNEAILKHLHQQGVKIVLCTGRPINAIWKYIEQLELTNDEDYTITFNGALVIQNVGHHELFKRGISKQDLALLHDYSADHGYPLDVLDFDQVYPLADLNPSIYQKMLNANLTFTPTAFPDLADQTYSKAVMALDPATLDDATTNLTAAMQAQYHTVRSQPQILEFLAAGMDKHVGLSALLAHYGWTFDNLMTFGDAENDLGMLTAAKVGVVMDNGKPEIKAAETHVTGNNDDDGVAQFLETFDFTK